MPSCCGSTGSCACKVSGGSNVVVGGSGSPQDPFVISADMDLQVVDNQVFDLNLSGDGTIDSPWLLGVNFAPTATISDLPDVAAPTPANGQVLGWNSSLAQWVPQDPVTAPAGAVTHDGTLLGDGSAGAPLRVVSNGAKFIISELAGVGMTDPGINQLVRHFVNDVDRQGAAPTPMLNTLSVLDSVPGKVDYWDGTKWAAVKDNYNMQLVAGPNGNELLRLSGPYVAGAPLTYYVKQVNATTDSSGQITLLSTTDLTGRAGIISVNFQEIGTLAFRVIPFVSGAVIKATAFHLTDGLAWPGQIVSGTCTAWLY